MTNPPPGKETLNASLRPPPYDRSPCGTRQLQRPKLHTLMLLYRVPFPARSVPPFMQQGRKTQLSPLRRGVAGSRSLPPRTKQKDVHDSFAVFRAHLSRYGTSTFLTLPCRRHTETSVSPHAPEPDVESAPTDKAHRKTTKKHADLYREAGFRK